MPGTLRVGSGRALLSGQQGEKGVIRALSLLNGLGPADTVSRADAALSLNLSSLLYESVSANAPRFDNIQSVPGIAINAARTNLALRNNEFNVAPWSKLRTTVTPGAAPGPKVGVNMDKIIPSSAAATTHNVSQSWLNALFADSSIWAFSVIAKAAEYGFALITINTKAGSGAGNFVQCYVNLNTGVFGTLTPATGSGLCVDRFVQPLAGGLWRITQVVNMSTGASNPSAILGPVIANNGINFTGDDVSGAYFSLPQLENASHPSIPIETTTVAVARAADLVDLSLSLPVPDGYISMTALPMWDGNDGVEHVLLDAGASTTQNRLLIVKDAANNLVLRIFGDVANGSKEIYGAVNATTFAKRVSHTIETLYDRFGHMSLWLDGTLLADGQGTGGSKLSGVWTRPSSFGSTARLGALQGAGGSAFGGIISQVKAKSISTRNFTTPGTRTRFPRSNANLLISNNPTVSGGATGYTLTKTAVYDGSVTLTPGDGTGSIKMPANNGVTANRGRIVSSRVVVSPSTHYTFDFSALSTRIKGALVVTVQEYSAANAFIRNAGGRRIYFSAANDVEDSSFTWKTNSDVGRVQIQVDVDEGDDSADIWLDNFYIGLDISFPVTATKERATFDSPMVRIDPIGNLDIYENGAWVPKIPIAIYQDPALSDYSKYANQGFNLAMFNSGLAGSLTQTAKNATNVTYAPQGMYNCIELSEYFDARNAKYQNTADMISKMPSLLAHAAADHILFGYLDVETYTAGNIGVLVFDDVTNIIALWRTYDKSRPLILNGGMEGQGRYFGPYVEGMMSYGSNRQNTGLSHQNGYGVTRPYSFTILSPTDSSNNVVLSAADYKQQFWRAFYEGTRGISVYKDQPVATGQNLDNASFAPLWAMFKTCADEVLLPAIFPVLRTPDFASFTAIPADIGLLVGPRDYNGKGHAIIVNDTLTDITTTITLAGLGYTPASAVDLFAVDSPLTITAGVFTITVVAQDRKVLRFD